MKVVIDTNVLVSATFWYGNSFNILEMADNRDFEIYLSREILKEYVEVLDYKEIKNKIEKKKLDIKYTITKIISICNFVEPSVSIDAVKDDPDDNKILECAVTAKVKYIISQDKHLLKLGNFKGIQILTPTDFLKLK